MLNRARNAAGIAAAALVIVAFLQFPLPALAQTPAKLLISQVEVRGGQPGTPGEYIVIKNPGSATVDLSDYYLTDATFAGGDQYYYNLPDDSLPIGGGAYNDFVARFPDGATLGPGEQVSIAVDGSEGFYSVYGIQPNYELWEDGTTPDEIPDMRDARPGSINQDSTPTLTNSGEIVILFYWDGQSDLVTDIDYVVWGDKDEAVDKTGVSIDGPDADSTPTEYQPDTPIVQQDAVAPFGNPAGTLIRVDDSEGTQKTSGGNGVDGRDETSENLSVTFTSDTDGTPPGSGGGDTTPPTLLGASGNAGENTVGVTFSEPVGTGAETVSNYSVYPTSSPSSTIAVTSASAASGSGALVTLTLASALTASTDYTVKVSNVQDLAGNAIAANSTASFTTGSGGLSVSGAFQFGKDYVAVAFSGEVNATQAVVTSNYSFTPSLSVSSAYLQENGRTVVLKTSSDLPKSTSYTVTASGVTGAAGGALEGNTASFQTSAATVTNIADVQNSTPVSGHPVTVIGQIFIPITSGVPNIYIQDGSARGLNVFGGNLESSYADRGNVIQVTGQDTLYYTTMEIVNPTAVSTVKSGMPKLAPKVLSVAQAASSQWEGTYIQTTSTLTAAPVASGASNYNYAAEGITFRVRNSTGINAADFHTGDTVTGAGAGGAYQTTFQINVGNAEDFYKGSGIDTTPPDLVSATGAAGSNAVTVTFSETVAGGASTASNYSVYPTASPSTPITVSAASASGSTVTLTLASDLAAATSYTVKVSNVQDAAGNLIAANSTVSFTTGGSGGNFQVAAIYQFGPAQVAVAFSDLVNASQAVTASNYTLTPSVSIQSVTVQDNGQTAILETASNLPLSTSYTVAVSGVTSAGGSALQAGGPTSFTTVNKQVVGIDQIQTNLSAYKGTSVNVIGQAFIPVLAEGSHWSGWIQDGTGRGINIFDRTGAQAAIDAVGDVGLVSATVDTYFTTVELVNVTSTPVASGVPKLGPKVLSVAEAASSQWEGTYIQTTSTLTAEPVASGSYAYNLDAQGITFRIRNLAGINTSQYHSGDTVTGAGAGGAFQETFQINVGNAADFYKGSGEDTTPPDLVSASGNSGANQVTVSFSETVASGASTASNYSVYETASPSNTIAVTSASVSGSTVTLTLASNLAASTNYTVKVSNVQDVAGNTIAANSTVTFTTGGGAEELTVTGAFQFGRNYVAVTFSAAVNATQAVVTSNYSFSPSLSISSAYVQENGQTVVLQTAADLPKSAGYSVTVSGVSGHNGEALTDGSASFQTSSATIMNIADVHATAPGNGRTITVLGQVYIPITSGTVNIYIQDGSARGLNVFGGAFNSAYSNRSAVVQVTGPDTLYYTTLEIVNPTSTSTVATGAPRLAPKILSVAQAANSQWEGTYIQTTATLTAAPVASGASNYNYQAQGIAFRVRNSTGIDPAGFSAGDEVTGAGAGGAYQSTFQINVGNADDFSKGGGPGDTTPPVLGSASGSAGSNRVTVVFSEPVGTGANAASNYEVYPTAEPSAQVSVISASVSSATVTLTLGGDLEAETSYTVRVNNVQDLAGNVILPNSTVGFVTSAERKGRLVVPARTLIKNTGERIEIKIDVPIEPQGKITCRVFDLQGRLVKVLLDEKFTGSGTYTKTLSWDARDDTFELVPAGMYICHLMTTDLNGNVTKDQAPIVVAVRLD